MTIAGVHDGFRSFLDLDGCVINLKPLARQSIDLREHLIMAQSAIGYHNVTAHGQNTGR